MRIRTLLHPAAYKWLAKKYSFSLRNMYGEWRDADEDEECLYDLTQTDDWISLSFTPNHTQEFRVTSLSTIDEVELLKNRRSAFSISTVNRGWIFIQLPWSKNPQILRRISQMDAIEYPNAAVYNIVNTSPRVNDGTLLIKVSLPPLPEKLGSLPKKDI